MLFDMLCYGMPWRIRLNAMICYALVCYDELDCMLWYEISMGPLKLAKKDVHVY